MRASSRGSRVSMSGGGARYRRSRTLASVCMRVQNSSQLAASAGLSAANGIGGTADVARQLEVSAAVERHRDPWVRLLETKRIQAQIANHPRRHPADVRGQVGSLMLLHDDDTLAGTREVVRGDETVRAGANDDRVVALIAHVPSFRMRIAASRPEAPMIPPPGCVPEPAW